jgi:DNA polymerase-3 subunit delta
VKVLTRNLNAFLNKPPDHILAVLIYGKDAGLVHERVLRITRAVVGDAADPFRVSELGSSEILSNPSKLTDEFTAQCLVGGRRVVRIRLGSENLSDSLRALFKLPKQNTLIVVEAGFLRASSSVRRFMEKETKTAVIACYQDTPDDLSSLISELTKPQGLNISSAAKNYLLNHLGSDRMVSRSELEKLVLFAGSNADVSIEDVIAIIGDSSAFSIEDFTAACNLYLCPTISEATRCVDAPTHRNGP